MIKKVILFLLPVLFLISCQPKSKRQSLTDFDIPDSIITGKSSKVTEEAMEEIIQNVSSPIEMAILIKELGVPFSTKYLATTDYLDNYNTSIRMAYSLGVYGADLCYLNIYDKSAQIVDYISAINKLADGIKVGHFFDFPTLKRLATSRENIDSLMYISVNSFNNMDTYLRENNRGHLSSLIVTGSWIEGMFLVTQVAKEKIDPSLSERIGEQKLNLNNILLILKNYKNHPQIEEIFSLLNEIKEEYDNVKITYEIGDPEIVEQDGMLMIVQNEKSIVHITSEQLEKIINKTEEIRNKLITI